MLRFHTDRETVNDLVRLRINDVHSVTDTIGDIEAHRETTDDRAQVLWPCVGIDVVWSRERGHARQGLV